MTATEIERLARVETKLDDMEGRLDRQFAESNKRLDTIESKLDTALALKADSEHVKGLSDSLSKKADADDVKALADGLAAQRASQFRALWWAITTLAITGLGTVVYVIQGHIHF